VSQGKFLWVDASQIGHYDQHTNENRSDGFIEYISSLITTSNEEFTELLKRPNSSDLGSFTLEEQRTYRPFHDIFQIKSWKGKAQIGEQLAFLNSLKTGTETFTNVLPISERTTLNKKKK